MLTILYGKASTGKTGRIMGDMKSRMEAGGKSILLVPEQYSHQAERELCGLCGSRASLYAEVLTFTGFARWVDSRLGSGDGVRLDKGGQLLCMALAVDTVYTQLKVYGGARRRAALQAQLLDAVTELKTACVDSTALMETAAVCDGLLGDKLYDLALILEAYDAIVARGSADPTDALTRLAERVPEAGLQDIHLYIDGFTDFTRQQLRVISALLDSGCSLTVCLTCDDVWSDNEVYAIPRSTLRALHRLCGELDVACSEVYHADTAPQDALRRFRDGMFTYTREEYEDETNQIRLYAADSMADECEFAAAEALRLVRDTGCRWRDIAIAVRGFSDYETLLDSTFRRYEVPVYMTKKSALLAKPLPRLIASAYETLATGWDPEDVFAYLRTGLTGMEPTDCDLLENYVLLWNLRGNAWLKDEDWRLHPAGYQEGYTDRDKDSLRRINALRRQAAGPLGQFAQAVQAADTGHEQVLALVQLLETLGVDGLLERRADALEAEGYPQQAAECEQLWELTLSALEQFDSILGETDMDAERFAQLFLLMLSQYEVGTIPMAVDCVTAGEMDRMRRRNIRHLILLGARDDRLPRPEEGGGVLTTDDRTRLMEVGLELSACGEAELWREFGRIYNCLTLPKETLTMTYARAGEGRPSVVFNRAAHLFDKKTEQIDPLQCKTAARDTALELAAYFLRETAPGAAAAAAYFRERTPEVLEQLETAAERPRGSLSRGGVEQLYGSDLRLSASRIDRFNNCPFHYFVEYGLKAKPRKPAGFNPPEMGTFMHYVLEHVAKAVMELGGFKEVSQAKLRELTRVYIEQYITQYLGDFKEKSPRFVYLFRRLEKDVTAVVEDMAAELAKGEFVPLAFELDFSDREVLPPMVIGRGDSEVTVTGIADRVDGWVHDGKLYLRVVDYKTGKKAFKLSDIYYGMNLQMLLYLFTLEKWGKERYGMDVVPAGVLYIPAGNKHIAQSGYLTDEELAKERAGLRKRSGMILNDEELIRAMERGDSYTYLPIKLNKSGERSSEALASAEQLGMLSRHIDKTLQELAGQLRGGDISAAPCYKSSGDNACSFCEYAAVCGFADGENGEHYRVLPAKSAKQVWEQLTMEELMQEGGAEDGGI